MFLIERGSGLNQQPKKTAIDLFCGAGGVSEALKNFFKIVGAVEYDPIIASSYKLNHGQDHLIVKDIREISKKEWLQKVQLKPGELDLLVATPPCQGFSRHSRKKAEENIDERNDLILEVIKVTDIYQPRYIFFENVDNIVNYKVFHTFLRRLVNLKKDGNKRTCNRPSYHVNFKIVDASRYGVPQTRRRLILIAKRIDVFPCKEAFVKIPREGVPIVIKPLDVWPSEEPAPTLGEYLAQFKLKPIGAGETDPDDPLHTSRRLSDLNLKRIQATPHNGGSRDSWPPELLLDCHKKKNVSFGDVYGRMDFNKYSPTITCGCISYTKGRFGHPVEDRAISLREAALIQTFPLDYKFTGLLNGKEYEGAKDKIAMQIGNAVPVKMAYIFIKEIAKHIDKEK
jgi:DNA (cytosine-5)-methyltransferase 1